MKYILCILLAGLLGSGCSCWLCKDQKRSLGHYAQEQTAVTFESKETRKIFLRTVRHIHLGRDLSESQRKNVSVDMPFTNIQGQGLKLISQNSAIIQCIRQCDINQDLVITHTEAEQYWKAHE